MDESDPRAEWIDAALQRHGAALIRYAATITGDEDSARDVVQDTFCRLCRETPENLDGHLVEWLFTVCRNRALDMQRKLHRLEFVEEVNDAADSPSALSPADAAEQSDTLSVILGLVESLPERQKELVRLKFQAGLSYEEMSRVTHLSVSNVGFILHTALKTLRQRFQRVL